MPRRPPQPMPKAVLDAFETRGVLKDYEARPFYQRNDYLAWIARAKRAETRERRLAQMLDELEEGGVYMKMAHAPSRRS